MQQCRSNRAPKRASLSESLSQHALLAGGSSSSRHSDTRLVGEMDPDLAALKAGWSWNFASAPRTMEQEDKQWFSKTHSNLAGVSRPKHMASKIACARCGLPLHIEELISHQAECLGEHEVSSDEDNPVTRPRWRGPLDNHVPKASRRFRLSDTPDFSHLGDDFEANSFIFGGSGVSGGPPRYFGGWQSAAPRSSSSSSPFSSQAGADFWRDCRGSSSSSSLPTPPRRPPSPPQRQVPAASRSPIVSAPGTAALDTALSAHEGAWARFDASKACDIHYADVPWPDYSKATSDTLLVQHVLRKATEAGDVKAVLRKLQLRWHPDKWAQRFASRLSSEDAERTLTRVKEIAQIVNGLKAST